MLYRVPRLRRVASLVFYKGGNGYFLIFFSRKCANVIQCQQNYKDAFTLLYNDLSNRISFVVPRLWYSYYLEFKNSKLKFEI